MLEQLLNDLAKKICTKRGFRTPYDLVIQPELPMDNKQRERIVIIQAGNPPLIRISRLYIEACVAIRSNNSTNLPKLRDTIERSLEFLPKMYHTLSLVPVSQAVALRKDAKKWARANVPHYESLLDDRYFKSSYTVTVTDTITNTSVTETGNDIREIELKAKKSLSRMILQSEELEAYREEKVGIDRLKNIEVKPNVINITIADNTIESQVEY